MPRRARRSWFPLPPSLLAAALLASACGGAETDGVDVYRVAFVPPADAAQAAAARQGLELALSELSVDGAPSPRVEIVPLASDGEACATAVTGDRVDAVVGLLTGEALAACAEAASTAGVPYLSAARTPGEICASHFYQVAALPNQIAEAVVAFAAEEGGRRYFLVGSDDAWSRALFAAIDSLARAGGGSVVRTGSGAADLGGVVSDIAASGADVVVESLGDRASEFLVRLHEDPRTTTLRVVATSAGDPEMRSLGAAAEGVLVVSDYFEAIQSADNQRFVEALRAAAGASTGVRPATAATYDALRLVTEATRGAEGDPPTTVAALPATRIGGPRGPVAFPDGGRYSRVSTYAGRARADGSVELVTFRPNVEPRTSCG